MNIIYYIIYIYIYLFLQFHFQKTGKQSGKKNKMKIQHPVTPVSTASSVHRKKWQLYSYRNQVEGQRLPSGQKAEGCSWEAKKVEEKN